MIRQVAGFAPLIVLAAATHGLDPWTLAALVAEESGGNPYALRVERGWLARYWRGSLIPMQRTPTPAEQYWMTLTDLAQGRYGLTQVPYIVAVQHGVTLRYPTELCEPRLNLFTGARHLAHLAGSPPRPEANMLEAYDGSADQSYPLRVLAWRDRLRQDTGFPRLDALRAP